MAKFQKGNAGRPVGSENKLKRTVREVVLETFNHLQTTTDHNLSAWAEKNPKDFYLIAAKLIPTEIKATVESERVTINLIKAPLPEDATNAEH